jgi:hypothetical protein
MVRWPDRDPGGSVMTAIDEAGSAEDFEALLALTGSDTEGAVHAVHDGADALFTWDYQKGQRPALEKLYEKAKTSQWNAETDLDWSADVDPERVAREIAVSDPRARHVAENAADSPLAGWGDREWTQYYVETLTWRMSQFLHGEQGALICTAKIVETVPWIDAKYYAATQVMDEARHVEVFAKYLNTKLESTYPINAHLGALLDDIINDSRWDMTYLGMQIMVEGLALAAFGSMHKQANEPLLKKLLRYVMSDEARHVAFGVLSLQEVYAGMDGAEIRERQEFAFEAGLRMRDRFLQQEIWERLGINVKSMMRLLLDLPASQNQFSALLFSKIVPNCKKLGLLDAGDGWLRDRFTEIGVIQFEDWADTGDEYESLDEVARDRAGDAA